MSLQHTLEYCNKSSDGMLVYGLLFDRYHQAFITARGLRVPLQQFGEDQGPSAPGVNVGLPRHSVSRSEGQSLDLHQL